MKEEDLIIKYKEELQGIKVQLKEWLKSGFAGGMAQMESAVMNHLSKLEKQWLEEILKECADGYTGAYVDCKWCGEPAKFKDRYEKRVNTLCQEQKIIRAYYYCSNCGKGFCPLDDKLKIESQEISPGLRKVTTQLGTQMPFEPTAQVLWETRRVIIAEQTVRRVTEKTGEQIEKYKKGIWNEQKLISTKDFGRDQPKQNVLYSGGDGTSVNILGEGWKQPKLSITYKLESGRITQRRYSGGFLEKDEFARRWQGSAEELNLRHENQYVVIQDGAGMLWDITQEIFPEGIQIVDWFHAKERLYTIGKLVYGEKNNQATQWSKKAESLLWHGKVDEVIEQIKLLKPRGKNAKDFVRQSIGYYTDHAHRMNYPKFRARGYNIGSGPLEGGACKNIVGDRLKRTGMRWSKVGAHNTIQARASLLDESIYLFWKDCYAISLP